MSTSELDKLAKEIAQQHMLMNDALADGEEQIARFHDGIRCGLYEQWTRLKEKE